VRRRCAVTLDPLTQAHRSSDVRAPRSRLA
jgi:hypothetical protein